MTLLPYIGILLTGAASMLAQSAPSDQQVRSLLVNVLDRQGNAVRGLTSENFRIRINNKPAAVVNASYSLAPRRIVVLLDMSGSMSGGSEKNKKWLIAREALRDLLEQTPPEVPLALITFSNQVHDFFDFSQDWPALEAWLKGRTSDISVVRGHTALKDAIVAGVKMLQPSRPGDAIYAITDGRDNSSRSTATQVKRALLDSGVRMFAFLFSEPLPFLTYEDGRDGWDIQQTSRESGGFIFGVRGSEWSFGNFRYDYNDLARGAIRSHNHALAAFVNGFYTLEIKVPQLRKDAKIKLDISDNAGAARTDVTFIHPSLLSAKK